MRLNFFFEAKRSLDQYHRSKIYSELRQESLPPVPSLSPKTFSYDRSPSCARFFLDSLLSFKSSRPLVPRFKIGGGVLAILIDYKNKYFNFSAFLGCASPEQWISKKKATPWFVMLTAHPLKGEVRSGLSGSCLV